MADIVLDTVDLTVFGGPTSLSVSTDIGIQGERGSLIFGGSGVPASFVFPETVQLYDMYINTATTGNYPGWLYQYNADTGNADWEPILQLVPAQYSAIATQTFVTGSTTISVPLASITNANVTDLSKLHIRYNISKSVPVASGFTYSLTGTHPNKNIEIVIKGISYASSTWSDLTGSHDIHLLINYKA